jgi:hypothetical protein
MKKHLTINLLLFFIIMTITGAYARADSNAQQKAFLDAEAILAGWRSTYESIRTMRVLYSHRLLDYKPPAHNPDEPAPVAYSYIEKVEDGKRYHMRDSTAEDTFDKPENLIEYAFDGKTTKEYFGGSKSGSIVLGLTGKYPEVTNHLKNYMLLDTQHIQDYIDEYPNGIPTFVYTFRRLMSSAIVRPNLESVAGQLCHVVEFSSVGPYHDNKYQFWVAHDKGMCLMRYRAVFNHNNKGKREIEVEQIAMAKTDTGVIWYPVKAYETVVTNEVGAWKNELTVKEFIPNVKVDENTFKFAFPNGTWVVDRVLGIVYTVGVKDIDEVPTVEEFKSSKTEPAARKTAQTTPDLGKTSEEQKAATSITDKEENQSLTKSVIAKDRNKILGVKSISILGIVIVTILGMLLWYMKRSRA